MNIDEAFRLADEQGLDVAVVGKGDIPVCKLLDYEKHIYELKKQAKKQKANQSVLKEIRLTPQIAANDLKIKAKTASRILGEGDKLRIEIMYRGRMARLVNEGAEKLERFESLVEHPHKVANKPKVENNRVYMIIEPIK